MSDSDAGPRAWFEEGKKIPDTQRQYTYFTEGFRKDPAYHPWAWVGVGVVWIQRGNVEGGKDAFEKAIELRPNFAVALQELKRLTRTPPVMEGETEIPHKAEIASGEINAEKKSPLKSRDIKGSNNQEKQPPLPIPPTIEPETPENSPTPSESPRFKRFCKRLYEDDPADADLLEFREPKEPDMTLMDLMPWIEPSKQYPWAGFATQLDYLLNGFPLPPGAEILESEIPPAEEDANGWFELGMRCSRNKHWEEASSAFEKASRLDPGRSRAWAMLGLSYFMVQKLAEAVPALNRAIKLDPEDTSSRNVLGKIRRLQGDLDGACKEFRRVIDINPFFPSPWDELGITLCQKGNIDGAKQAFSIVLKLDPSCIGPWMHLGITHLRQSGYNEACNTFAQVLLGERDNARAWEYLGQAYHGLHHESEAQYCHKRAIHNGFKGQSTWAESTTVQVATPQEPRFIKQWRGDDIPPEKWYWDGGKYRSPEEAWAYLKRGLKKDQAYQTWAWVGIADYLLMQEDFDGAHWACARSLKLNSKFAPAWVEIGNIYHIEGNLPAATQAYEKATEIDPTHLPAWLNLGVMRHEVGDYEKAIVAYEQIIEKDPQFAPAWNNKGLSSKVMNKFAEARDAFEHALLLQPPYASAWYNLGLTLEHLGQKREASYCFAWGCHLGHEPSMNNLHKLENAGIKVKTPEFILRWYAEEIKKPNLIPGKDI